MKRPVFIAILILSSISFMSCKEKKDIAVQLYSLHSMIGSAEQYAANHDTVLASLAEMGYTAVETANYSNGRFYGVTPAEFKADVEQYGMRVMSSHCGHELSKEELAEKDFSESLKWWDECIRAHKAAGMKYIVVPGFPVPSTLDGLHTYCEYFNAVGRKCKEQGILFGYHNHAHEFQTEIEGQRVIDYMIKNTFPEYVFFQMDVYWAVMGQKSPVDYFKEYPGRFRVLHIKDHREIGQSGMVGFDAIFNNMETAGTENIIVEIEAFTKDWKTGMKECIDYLNSCPEL